MTGKVALNSVGDREPNYRLSGTLKNGSSILVAKVINTGGDNVLQQVNNGQQYNGILHFKTHSVSGYYYRLYLEITCRFDNCSIALIISIRKQVAAKQYSAC